MQGLTLLYVRVGRGRGRGRGMEEGVRECPSRYCKVMSCCERRLPEIGVVLKTENHFKTLDFEIASRIYMGLLQFAHTVLQAPVAGRAQGCLGSKGSGI